MMTRKPIEIIYRLTCIDSIDLFVVHSRILCLSVKDLRNKLIVLQDHIDYLQSMKSNHFSISTSNVHLFYLDTHIDHECSHLQSQIRSKLRDIDQTISELNDANLKDQRLQMIRRSIEEELNNYRTDLKEIVRRREIDNDDTFEQSTTSFSQIEQIQSKLKVCSKQLQQLVQHPSHESLTTEFEHLRSMINEEYIQWNRFTHEYKYLDQLTSTYRDLNEQINEYRVRCVVNEQSSSVMTEHDQRPQLAVYHTQIREQLTIIEHHGTISSMFLTERINRLHSDLVLLYNELESIMDKELQRTSTQMHVEQAIESLENEFKRRPIFSSMLNVDTLNNYEKRCNDYYQTLNKRVHDLHDMIEQFVDVNYRRRYAEQWTQLNEHVQQSQCQYQLDIEHLQHGVDKYNTVQMQLRTIVDQLDECERQLTSRMIMKEVLLKQTLHVRVCFIFNGIIHVCFVVIL
jgi:uncharacterized phage infection (PIP) family protein YhgE